MSSDHDISHDGSGKVLERAIALTQGIIDTQNWVLIYRDEFDNLSPARQVELLTAVPANIAHFWRAVD